jgi:hypothetical protein
MTETNLYRQIGREGLLHNNFELPTAWEKYIQNEEWAELDHFAGQFLQKDQPLGRYLGQIYDFKQIEHILALRQAPGDEEGIWHDDGSRALAFSLSLNLRPSIIKGGKLFLRPKGSQDKSSEKTVYPRPWGQITLFATGQQGWEHRTECVSGGSRLVLAGWLT